MLEFDHLAISCAALDEGAAAVEAVLGVPLVPGGEHGFMGTHNRPLGLGPGVYLEVIAINPAAPHPGRPRWFDLDHFIGPPRLTNWVARTNDIDSEPVPLSGTLGPVHDLRRGDYRWRMTIPEDGKLPFDGAHPAIIEWLGALHPADRLPDSGCRLKRLVVRHPRAEALRADLEAYLLTDRVVFETATQKFLRAEIETPHGLRVLE